MTSREIQQFLKTLPHLPGVYKYFDNSRKPIYVGKAKDLRKRVSSYFTKTHESQRIRNLVKNIHHIEFTIVDTEREALLLEDSLIKHLRPRYNIDLKDDKSYPYIVIKNESFPRIILTRKIMMDGSEYFGPFTNVGKIRELLELIRTSIPLRKNNLDLFLRITHKNELKVSPEYYMSDGRGKDEEILTEADYEKGLQQVRDILKGKMTPLIAVLQQQMKNYVDELEFEKAEVLQHKIEFMREYKADSVVVNGKVGDLDVFTIILKNTKAFINYLLVRKGAIVQSQTMTFMRKQNDSEKDILVSAIVYLQKKNNSAATELVVPFPIKYVDPTVVITIPKRGIKKKLLDLSMKNLDYRSDKINQSSNIEIEANDY